jgi:glycosyltransferase involved in cell wall biosynthesis
LKAADLVLLPSISNEDLPLVLIESFMLGKCIIGTSLAGISEVIKNNINGFLVTSDVNLLMDDLYEKINFLYANPSEIIRISSGAKKFSECFSENKYGQILSKLYNS